MTPSASPDDVGIRVNAGRRLVVRIVFVAVLIALPVELAVARYDAEPYPALFQPGFAGHPFEHGFLDVQRPVLDIEFADGSSASPRYDRLLPASGLDPIQVFQNEFYTDRAARSAETKSWLKSRIGLLYPDRPVRTLTIKWQDQKYARGHRGVVSAKTVRTVVIPL